MVFHGIELFLRLCKRNYKFTILSIICLLSSFFSLLFLFERGYFQCVVDTDMEQVRQVLYFSSRNEKTIEQVYYTISADPILPKLKIATVSGNRYAGLFWNVESEKDAYYTPYGRFFNNEEISSNAHVVLIGTGYLSTLPHNDIDLIWDTGIEINNIPFTAIGSYNYNWGNGESIPPGVFCSLPLPAAVTMPIKTFFDIGLKATRIRCVFSEPLTEEQAVHLDTFLKSFSELENLVFPQTEKSSRMNTLSQLFKNIAPFSLIVVLSILNTSNIILYWLRTQFARFQIYHICGANNGNIACLISIPVVLLVCISFTLARAMLAILHIFIPYGIIAQLPASLYSLILAVQLAFIISLNLLKSFHFLLPKT